MKLSNVILVILITFSLKVKADSTSYRTALNQLHQLIIDKPSDGFKQAVFLVENTYLNGNLDYNNFQNQIDEKCNTVIGILKGWKIEATEYNKLVGITTVLIDTITFDFGEFQVEKLPASYNFNDPFGSENWESMFVTEYLENEKFNCHSAPFLYLIMANELDVKAHLTLAPNHIFIKHKGIDKYKHRFLNVELTSKIYPLDAVYAKHDNITYEAILNGYYLDTLSYEESIALTILDLAQGYKRNHPEDSEFVLKCIELAMDQFPKQYSNLANDTMSTCLNAQLLKFDVLLGNFERSLNRYGYSNLEDVVGRNQDKIIPDSAGEYDLINLIDNLFSYQEVEAFKEIQNIMVSLTEFGYVEMKKEDYIKWIDEMNIEKDKITNKDIKILTHE